MAEADTQRMPRLIGVGDAMRLILSGEMIGAEEALRIGKRKAEWKGR